MRIRSENKRRNFMLYIYVYNSSRFMMDSLLFVVFLFFIAFLGFRELFLSSEASHCSCGAIATGNICLNFSLKKIIKDSSCSPSCMNSKYSYCVCDWERESECVRALPHNIIWYIGFFFFFNQITHTLNNFEGKIIPFAIGNPNLSRDT